MQAASVLRQFPITPTLTEAVLPKNLTSVPDIICFCHLRWNFVYQRPQHLMQRFAADHRIYYFEESIFGEPMSHLSLEPVGQNIIVATPHLPAGLSSGDQTWLLRKLVHRLCEEQGIVDPILWYYSPMALSFTDEVRAASIVYDCMDELTAFAGAPPELRRFEADLIGRASVVFTGGQSLFESKRRLHERVYAFPSSVDVGHFRKARQRLPEPPDQASIPHPRIGHYAVLDERLDKELIAAIADARPDWQLVLIGPVVKIDPATLPRRPNIHYLGMKSYAELPSYLAGWDVAFMPFALNESTRFISPTKTPEYLAAGRRVVSTPIVDVVRTYGDQGLVQIATTPDEFIACLEAALAERAHGGTWLKEVDELLDSMSWDRTWASMREFMA
ncbi:MAG: glycosyltransferase family 1 protein [Geminicoccaceae bacterium]